jgi:hypothetical protein
MWASCGLAGVIAALEPNLIRTVIRSQGTRNVKFELIRVSSKYVFGSVVGCRASTLERRKAYFARVCTTMFVDD